MSATLATILGIGGTLAGGAADFLKPQEKPYNNRFDLLQGAGRWPALYHLLGTIEGTGVLAERREFELMRTLEDIEKVFGQERSTLSSMNVSEGGKARLRADLGSKRMEARAGARTEYMGSSASDVLAAINMLTGFASGVTTPMPAATEQPGSGFIQSAGLALNQVSNAQWLKEFLKD